MSAQSKRPSARAALAAAYRALAEALEQLAREEACEAAVAVPPSAPSSRSRVRQARPIERPAGESDEVARHRARKILKNHGFIARAR